MVASFLRTYRPEQLTARQVRQLLGPATGYYDYDADPAYVVGPPVVGNARAKGYLLVFLTDKETGKVVKAIFVPEVR